LRILVIGGTGFIGTHVVRKLVALGNQVFLFHRGTTTQSPLQENVEVIRGTREELPGLRVEADIVIDLILSSGRQAAALMDNFRGRLQRIVAASSIDVYRSCGILHGSETGPLEPVPLTEDSALRTRLQTYPPEQIEKLKGVFGWLDNEYDKIPVERAVLSDPGLPGTVLRLPMIYGPGDRLSRLRPLLQRMDDSRPAILIEEPWANWRSPRGYVENVAAAIVLAAVSARAAGRVYNVAEKPSFSELEWARQVAAAAHWRGEFVTLPTHRMPPHLRNPGNAAQHWETSSSGIREELSYVEPVPLEEALDRTIAADRESRRLNPVPSPDYAAEDEALRS
jgi:nucleoside-diphosphate-sugar epimerase